MVLLRALAVWGILLLLAVLNGALRELVLAPRIGATPAHVASTLLLAGVVLLVAGLFGPWIGPADGARALQIGLGWALLTLAFEFVGGHFLFGRSWGALLADYDLRHGRIWPLIPLILLLAPWLTRRAP